MTENLDTEIQSYVIPLVRWDDFLEKLGKLNRRAKRLGTQAITYTVLGDKVVERTQHIRTEDGDVSRDVKVRAREITIAGPAPKLNGWQLAGRVETLGTETGAINLIHAAPAFDGKIDARLRTLGQVCEHCNTRRIRKDVFIVIHEDGTQKLVGRQCLADFTGYATPEHAAAVCQWLISINELAGEGAWGPRADDPITPVASILAVTSATIRAFGWASRKIAEQNGTAATGDLVQQYLFGTGKNAAELRSDVGRPTDEDKAEAERVIVWVGSLEPRSDYEQNLKALVVHDVARPRHINLIASAVASYQRAQNRLREQEAKRQANLVSEHVGAVKERLRDVKVTVEAVRSFEGHFGPVTLVKFRDEQGNLFSWFASGDHRLEHGKTYSLTGTVKKHSEYQGIKETQLSRCVFA